MSFFPYIVSLKRKTKTYQLSEATVVKIQIECSNSLYAIQLGNHYLQEHKIHIIENQIQGNHGSTLKENKKQS